MCKKHLSRARALLVASFSTLILGCQSTPLGDAAAELAREQLGVSILTVNLHDILNVPHAATGVAWQTRYAQISMWMTDTKTFPDVVVLQEAPGFWSCPTDPGRLGDYEAFNFLLNGIRVATGEQYRIAYLIAGKAHGADGTSWIGTAPAQFCSTQGGIALLYRPSRIRNVITRPGTGEAVVSPYSVPLPLQTTYLARSVQCCSPAPGSTDVCQVIDGPLDTPQADQHEPDRAACPTPLGVAWTRSRVATQGQDRTRPTVDAVFSRLELVGQPGNYVHIYNVHRGWNEQNPQNLQILDFGSQNINQLVTDMETRFQSSGPLLYPPILVGDFNVGSRPTTFLLDSFFPRFEVATWSNGGEVDGALFGRGTGNVPNFPPAKQTAYANLEQHMPTLAAGETCENAPAKVWSDHCALFFRVEPSRR
jgi:hypothetical protein